MHVTPRDLAKFGYLYLRDGAWEDRQVVPSDWVRASVRAGARIISQIRSNCVVPSRKDFAASEAE
jgi:CubicO group peptidase (beta-lactamase class C family)